MNATEITDDLAVGSFSAIAEMYERGWRPICFADDLDGPLPVYCRHFPMIDGGGSCTRMIEQGIYAITGTWRDQRKVFSCCRHGMNRSAIMAAAAMTIAGRTLWLMDALKIIVAKREIVSSRDTTLWDVLGVVKRIKGI